VSVRDESNAKAAVKSCGFIVLKWETRIEKSIEKTVGMVISLGMIKVGGKTKMLGNVISLTYWNVVRATHTIMYGLMMEAANST